MSSLLPKGFDNKTSFEICEIVQLLEALYPDKWILYRGGSNGYVKYLLFDTFEDLWEELLNGYDLTQKHFNIQLKEGEWIEDELSEMLYEEDFQVCKKTIENLVDLWEEWNEKNPEQIARRTFGLKEEIKRLSKFLESSRDETLRIRLEKYEKRLEKLTTSK